VKLALGTAQFGMQYGVANNAGQPSEFDAKEIMQIASTHGINTIDTAIAYGESEKRLGRIGVPSWKIISKLPAISTESKNLYEEVNGEVRRSLQRLGIEQMYGLLLHRPEQLLEKNGDDLYKTLERLKKEGFVSKIGVSIYDPELLDILLSKFSFDLVQAPLSPFDQRVVLSGLAPRLTSLGIELHVRSIFLQGLLLMHQDRRPSYFHQWTPLWNRWHEWLQDMKITALEACLGYATSFPQVEKVIVGIESKNQLIEIIKATEMPKIKMPEYFSSDDLGLINPANWKYT
jgi:aryl-alcohol dehydrogenase-like predicted oxidoreductase